MIVMIDNYDSFTYNLVQILGTLGNEIEVHRNDQIDVNSLARAHPAGIVISPGPGGPDDAGVSKEVIGTLGPSTPILGVCLGHQCIGAVYGGEVDVAPRLMHGKVSQVYHEEDPLFEGVSNPFTATRYHSLIVHPPLPEALKSIAATREGEIMAIRHREFPVYGVQFHPESILTTEGKRILANFLALATHRKRKPTPRSETAPPSPAALQGNGSPLAAGEE